MLNAGNTNRAMGKTIVGLYLEPRIALERAAPMSR